MTHIHIVECRRSSSKLCIAEITATSEDATPARVVSVLQARNIPKTVSYGKEPRRHCSNNYDTKFSQHKKENFIYEVSFVFFHYQNYKKG